MSPVELTGRRYLAARIARVTGAAAWWVFVVGVLMGEVDGYYTPRRYADYDESIFGVGLGQSDAGADHHAIMRQTVHRTPAMVTRYVRESAPLIGNAVTVLGL